MNKSTAFNIVMIGSLVVILGLFTYFQLYYGLAIAIGTILVGFFIFKVLVGQGQSK